MQKSHPPHYRWIAPAPYSEPPSVTRVEVFSQFAIPSFQLVGLATTEVNEARERVRAAIESSSLTFPRRRITVNLAPSSVPKAGTGLDLAIALSILESEREPSSSSKPTRSLPTLLAAWGELSLDGALRPAGQALRVLEACSRAKVAWLIVSKEEETQFAHALNRFSKISLRVLACENLAQAWMWLYPNSLVVEPSPWEVHPQGCPNHSEAALAPPLLPLDPLVEECVAVSAVGAHHLLLAGARGTGKSYALQWREWLEPLADTQVEFQRELSASLRFTLNDLALSRHQRVLPTVKPASLLGSANRGKLQPGALALAHGGLLLADELAEWHRDARECLREPLETGVVHLHRKEGSCAFPAAFTLAATSNLCECGNRTQSQALPPAQFWNARSNSCRCSRTSRQAYLRRLSGPLLDRIDLVTVVTGFQNPNTRLTASPVEIKKRVQKCRDTSIQRWGAPAGQLQAHALEQLSSEIPQSARRTWESQAYASLRSRHRALAIALSRALWRGVSYPESIDFVWAFQRRPEELGIQEE